MSLPSIAADNDLCLECHSDPELEGEVQGCTTSMYVNPDLFKASVHQGMECVDCHQDAVAMDISPKRMLLVRIFGFTFLFIGIVMIGLIIFSLVFGYKQQNSVFDLDHTEALGRGGGTFLRPLFLSEQTPDILRP